MLDQFTSTWQPASDAGDNTVVIEAPAIDDQAPERHQLFSLHEALRC